MVGIEADSDAVVTNNYAYLSGGGLLNVNAGPAPAYLLLLARTVVSGNVAQHGSGGGTYNWSANAPAASYIYGSTVADNEAMYDGGGVYNGSSYATSRIGISASTISGNQANAGGAVWHDSYANTASGNNPQQHHFGQHGRYGWWCL